MGYGYLHLYDTNIVLPAIRLVTSDKHHTTDREALIASHDQATYSAKKQSSLRHHIPRKHTLPCKHPFLCIISTTSEPLLFYWVLDKSSLRFTSKTHIISSTTIMVSHPLSSCLPCVSLLPLHITYMFFLFATMFCLLTYGNKMEETKRPRDDGDGYEQIELPEAKRQRLDSVSGMQITLSKI